MNPLQSFFLFCSGVNTDMLKRTPSDVGKYAGIGATILFTGLFAAVAGGFAIYTVFGSYVAAVLFGLLWGVMIFNLDRYIVMSMKKRGSFLGDWARATPRLVLAILIAFVIAKPLELKLFASEIEGELMTMEQELYKTQDNTLRDRYLGRIDSVKNDIAALDMQIKDKEAARNELNLIAIQEADGTGGSQKRNMGPIYKAKKQDADLAQQELNRTIAEITPLIASKRSAQAALESAMDEDLVIMKRTKLNGFAAQLDALGRLGAKSSTIWWASLFITLLFIAIETAPIFTKLISTRSPYDYALDKHERLFENSHASLSSKLSLALKREVEYDKVVGDYELMQTTAAEKELIKTMIQSELQEIKKEPVYWAEYLKIKRRFNIS